MTFAYTVHRRGGDVSVVVTGEIDVSVAGPFGAALRELAQGEPTRHIAVDLRGLRFIDSTGIAALARAQRASRRHGCALVVTNPTGVVRRALQMTRTLATLSPQAD